MYEVLTQTRIRGKAGDLFGNSDSCTEVCIWVPQSLSMKAPFGYAFLKQAPACTILSVKAALSAVLYECGQIAPRFFTEMIPCLCLQVNFFLLRRLLGVRTKGSEKQGKVAKLAKGEVLMLNIGSMCTGARVLAVKSDLAKLQLTSPVCTRENEKIALSRRVEKHWRLIGWGQIQTGVKLDIPPVSY